VTGSPTEPKRLRHGYTNATTVEGRGNGKAADEERQCPDFPATPLRRVGSDGSALLHGDFGPQNMLFDEGTLQMAALVDWEFMHAGDRSRIWRGLRGYGAFSVVAL
jgi:hypothetical protein